jgi:hypothetical protein
MLICGYFINAQIFDANTGFGGGGVAPSGCIANGPFADYEMAIGPGYTIQPQCITGNITAGAFFQQAVEPTAIETCLSFNTFVDFWHFIEAGPHCAGHAGTMGLVSSLDGIKIKRKLTRRHIWWTPWPALATLFSICITLPWTRSGPSGRTKSPSRDIGILVATTTLT